MKTIPVFPGSTLICSERTVLSVTLCQPERDTGLAVIIEVHGTLVDKHFPCLIWWFSVCISAPGIMGEGQQCDSGGIKCEGSM